MLFIQSLSFTDQGIRSIKDAPKRGQAARDLAKKCGCEIKSYYLTTGDADFVVLLEAPNEDSVVKFAMAVGSLGNVHTRTSRAWTEAEYAKLVSELP